MLRERHCENHVVDIATVSSRSQPPPLVSGFEERQPGFGETSSVSSAPEIPNPARRGVAQMALALAICLMLVPAKAHAMHISDGILTPIWAGLWFVVAIPFIAWGLRDLRVRSARMPEFKPLVGLVGAAVFIISCMPILVPSAGTCSHPCGTGLAAILIGPTLTVVVTSVALLLQALFLMHGGFSALGANIVSMGVMGGFAGYGMFHILRRLGVSWLVAAFVAGMISDWATYATTSVELATALHGSAAVGTMIKAILIAFVPTQLPLGIFEGFLTMGAYRFIFLRRPELLRSLAKGGAV
jgi:cobalt/nickel transport system permease protein